MKNKNELLPKGSVLVVDKNEDRTFAGYFVDKLPWSFLVGGRHFSFAEGIIDNVYKGKVTRAFASGGGFLNIGIGEDVFLSHEKLLAEGDSVIVQVTTDSHDDKAFRVTQKISLASPNVILIIDKRNKVEYSKKLSENARNELKKNENEYISTLAEIIGCGKLIIRSSAEKSTVSEICDDIRLLANQWLNIRKKFWTKREPGLLDKRADRLSSFLSHYLPKVDCVITNDAEVEKIAVDYKIDNITFVEEELFDYSYALAVADEIIEKKRVINDKNVNIRFDYTDACTFIDVNSGNFSTKGASRQANQTNLLVVDEVARQISLRDITGAIVVDFLTVWREAFRQNLIDCLRESFKRDAHKVKVYSTVTSLGHVEIERERTYEKVQSDWVEYLEDGVKRYTTDYLLLKLLSAVENENARNTKATVILDKNFVLSEDVLNYVKKYAVAEIEFDSSDSLPQNKLFEIRYGDM